MWWHGVCVILVLLGILRVIRRAFASFHSSITSKNGQAPVVPGYPVIGNTLSLAQHGAAYIHGCRMQVEPNLFHTLYKQCIQSKGDTANQGMIAPFPCFASCKAASTTISGPYAYAICDTCCLHQAGRRMAHATAESKKSVSDSCCWGHQTSPPLSSCCLCARSTEMHSPLALLAGE